jgi:Type II secretion system (T2SS), protein E, N-terminal domain
MRDLFKPTLWNKPLLKRWEDATQGCESVACAGTKPSWHRMWARRHGTLLEGVFYCPQCLHPALLAHLSRLHAAALPSPPSNRIPLGLLMVARGKLTYNQVLAGLEAQRRARYGRIGDWFEKLGFVTEQEVTTALGLQWGCPVASSLDAGLIDSRHELPIALLEAFHILPLNYATSINTLYLAVGERVHHAALYAVEKMLDCRTQPCVAWRKNIAPRLERLRQQPRSNEVVFDQTRDATEMGRISASYITKTGASEVRLCRIGRFIWLRLKSRSGFTNLLFCMKTEAERPHAALRPVFPLPPSRVENFGGAQATE